MGGAICFLNDQLGILAGAVVRAVRVRDSDCELASDCYQTAYLAGLQARRSAERSQRIVSNDILFKAMRQAVYRSLRRRRETLLNDI